MDHGLRVTYLVSRLLEVQGRYTGRDFQDLCFLAMLHDVGAYKTDEIDRMVQFGVGEHLGTLHLRVLFSPQALAAGEMGGRRAVSPHRRLPPERSGRPCRDVAQIINLADRVDVFVSEHGRTALAVRLSGAVQGRAFWRECGSFMRPTPASIWPGGWPAGGGRLHRHRPRVSLSDGDIDTYLRMLVYTIDFRSQHTVTHTITTTRISDAVGLMGMSPRRSCTSTTEPCSTIWGKIGIPVEILEYPGRLSPQAMAVMRTHVTITGEILGGAVDSVTTQIALRHHEKLDGSGYPPGSAGRS